MLSLVDCTFAGNSARVGGGGLYEWRHAHALDCTFRGNTTTGLGGGLYNMGGSCRSRTAPLAATRPTRRRPE